MTAVGDDMWAWVDALPDGLDQAAAAVFEQRVTENRVQLGGQLYLFDNGQVWQHKDGKWKRGIITAADLTDETVFARVTA